MALAEVVTKKTSELSSDTKMKNSKKFTKPPKTISKA
jgi:hypothetical protein